MRISIFNPGFYVTVGNYGQRTIYYTYWDKKYWTVYNHYDEGTETPLWVSYLSGNGFLVEDIKSDHKKLVYRLNSEL